MRAVVVLVQMIGSDSPTKAPATSNSDGGPFEAAYQVSCLIFGLCTDECVWLLCVFHVDCWWDCSKEA